MFQLPEDVHHKDARFMFTMVVRKRFLKTCCEQGGGLRCTTTCSQVSSWYNLRGGKLTHPSMIPLHMFHLRGRNTRARRTHRLDPPWRTFRTWNHATMNPLKEVCCTCNPQDGVLLVSEQSCMIPWHMTPCIPPL